MTFQEIKARVMFQTNNDADDVGDFMPHLDGYANAGYDLLLGAWDGAHVGGEGYPPLDGNLDAPALPEWAHAAVCDYATWLVYRNGNPQKQQRGMQFLLAFHEALSRLQAQGGKAGARARFINWW